MNRATTFTGAITGAGILLIYALAERAAANDELMMVFGAVVGVFLLLTCVTWGITEVYKHAHFSAHIRRIVNKPFDYENSTQEDPYDWVRRRIYMFAFLCGFLLSIGTSAALLSKYFLDGASDSQMIAATGGCILFSLAVAVSVPWTWRLMFVRWLPALFAPVKE